MKNARLWMTFSLFLLLFFVAKAPVFSALFINEFTSDTSGTIKDPDWVEIYNSGPSSVDLSEYRLEDLNAKNKKTLTGIIDPSSFATFDWANRLDKMGDVISLIKINDSSLVDRVAYGDQGNDISAPTQGQSAGRSTDGEATWTIFVVATKSSTNNSSTPIPTLTPIPTSSPTPTPTNTPTPISTPTTKPTSVPTATKAPNPTKTPKPTSTPKPTFTPTPTPTKPPYLTLKPTSVSSSPTSIEPTYDIGPTSVLGESIEGEIKKDDKPSKITPAKGARVLGVQNNNLSKILISIGAIFLFACGILFFRSYINNKKHSNERL